MLCFFVLCRQHSVQFLETPAEIFGRGEAYHVGYFRNGIAGGAQQLRRPFQP